MRTFLQTALGYILANLALFLTGTDFANAEMEKCSLRTFGFFFFGFAGLSAVMNLEKKEERAECDDKCSKDEENK